MSSRKVCEYTRLLDFLRKIEVAKPIPLNTWKPHFTPVNASVSIILRLYIRDHTKRPKRLRTIEKQRIHGDPTQPLQLTPDEVDKYFQSQDHFDKANCEAQVFYIKRGDDEGDRFSGHVAFPGGKVEEGESLLEGAIRETHEEVGFDLLDSNNFALITQYPLTIPFMFMKNRRRMFVTSFVFIQLSFDEIQPVYQEREVQSSVWTSLEFLASHNEQFLWDRPQRNPRYKTDLTLLMPTFLLVDSEKYSQQDIYNDPSVVNKDFPLGGMTLYLTRHFLNFTGMKNIRPHMGYYKIQEVKNKTLSVIAGKFFSLFAINPQYYFQEAWKEYQYYVYLSSVGLATAYGGFKWFKSKNGEKLRSSKI
ncbi:unnamed protein product [Moneuplotes crassus]|uniref:Nudix hydrolase domain-containing protein n=1 Tax=Euplotes crassus TaxID=5936 RepID=A0AAD1XJX9_EUPCR|nr:unnamed protein product [Moneuplotes crassus]